MGEILYSKRRRDVKWSFPWTRPSRHPCCRPSIHPSHHLSVRPTIRPVAVEEWSLRTVATELNIERDCKGVKGVWQRAREAWQSMYLFWEGKYVQVSMLWSSPCFKYIGDGPIKWLLQGQKNYGCTLPLMNRNKNKYPPNLGRSVGRWVNR